MASWYGEPYHGRTTANGEVYDMHGLTAAHRYLPFGTLVRVTRRDTGAAVTVRINDRGPFVRGRIIDLSLGAAREIGLDVDGVAPVAIAVVGVGQAPPPVARRAEPGERGPETCWWVQIGAFGDESNAERARDALRDAGEKVVVSETPGELHRVRVGPFTERAEADAAVRRVQKRYREVRVVPCG
jgi:rare lipoprotein A